MTTYSPLEELIPYLYGVLGTLMFFKRFLFCVICTLVLTHRCYAAASIENISDDFKQYFEKTLKKNNVPGGAFIIVHGDQVVKVGTYGQRKKNGKEPIDANTVFRLASVSKTFAGTVASQLVHEHKLSWQQPITDYVPTLTLQDETQAKQITIGHIIGQSSGFMPNSYDNLINANVSMKKILPMFSKLTLMCNPGICYSYQNVAFSFIEQVIEQQSGQQYDALIQERIFTPLDMETASIGHQAFMETPNRAEPHIKTARGFKKVRVKPNYYQLASAAGVNASITDMGKWLIASMGLKPEIISDCVIEDITTPGIKTTKELKRREWHRHLNDAHYGKGWRVYEFDGEPLIYHAGWVSGYVTEVAYSPDLKIGMAILINAESRDIAKLGARFWSQVFKQYDKQQN